MEINESKQTYEIHFHEKYFDGGLDITLDGVKELITVLQMTVNKMEEIFNQEDKTLDI